EVVAILGGELSAELVDCHRTSLPRPNGPGRSAARRRCAPRIVRQAAALLAAARQLPGLARNSRSAGLQAGEPDLRPGGRPAGLEMILRRQGGAELPMELEIRDFDCPPFVQPPVAPKNDSCVLEHLVGPLLPKRLT